MNLALSALVSSLLALKSGLGMPYSLHANNSSKPEPRSGLQYSRSVGAGGFSVKGASDNTRARPRTPNAVCLHLIVTQTHSILLAFHADADGQVILFKVIQ